MSQIKLSNYDIILDWHLVNVKRNGTFEYIKAADLKMFENVYTIDGRLIANRIN